MKYNYSIGLDIAKKKLDVFVKKGNKKVAYTTISNDKKGFNVLEKVLKKLIFLCQKPYSVQHTQVATPMHYWLG